MDGSVFHCYATESARSERSFLAALSRISTERYQGLRAPASSLGGAFRLAIKQARQRGMWPCCPEKAWTPALRPSEGGELSDSALATPSHAVRRSGCSPNELSAFTRRATSKKSDLEHDRSASQSSGASLPRSRSARACGTGCQSSAARRERRSKGLPGHCQSSAEDHRPRWIEILDRLGTVAGRG